MAPETSYVIVARLQVLGTAVTEEIAHVQPSGARNVTVAVQDVSAERDTVTVHDNPSAGIPKME